MDSKTQKTQKTPKGAEIPVPKRGDWEKVLRIELVLGVWVDQVLFARRLLPVNRD